MSTVLEERSLPQATREGWKPWAILLAGLLLLYVPTYFTLARGLWRDDNYAHAPIILGVFAWLLWRRRDVLLDAALRPAPLAGALLLAVGLALYLLGRTQSIALFEMASHLPVITGAILLVRGTQGVRRLAFPLLFLLFAVPLPGFILDLVTIPLKSFVSATVAAVLPLAGYPVEREGVVLFLGDHAMLVADACSGMNSLFSLLALGLIYAHLTPRGAHPLRRMALIALGIVPIAVVANIVRVMLLVLVTYHLGPDAARGWIHDVAGMLVFVIAFGLLLAYDAALKRLPARGERSLFIAGIEELAPLERGLPGHGRRVALAAALAGGLAMAVTAAAAPAFKPVPTPGPAPDLERIVPTAFGDWKLDPNAEPVAPTADVEASLARLYHQVVSRSYVNSQGEGMMLTIAYGGDQSDALKVHRQEACYRAQGFEVTGISQGTLATAGRTIPVTRMHAVRGERSEPVTYWFTMGDRVVLSRAERLRVQLEHGFAGRIPDGMLVRVSSLDADVPRALKAQESFVTAILGAIPPAEATRFVGRAS